MRVGATYLVTGTTAYRGHAPGTEFEAALDAAAESRALLRGDIKILDRHEPALQPGSFVLPRGWTQPT